MSDPTESNLPTPIGRSGIAAPRHAIRPGNNPAHNGSLNSSDDNASSSRHGLSVQPTLQPGLSDKVSEAEGRNWPPQLLASMRKQFWPSLRMPTVAPLRAEPPSHDVPIDQLVLLLGSVAPAPVVMPEREKRIFNEPALISEAELKRVLDYIEANSETPVCDRVKVLLTIRAGLLPTELIELKIQSLFNDARVPLDHVTIAPRKGARTQSRKIPMHWQLRAELLRLQDEFPDAERITYRVGPDGTVYYQSAQGVIHWLRNTYERTGLRGCTSTSGRHTFAEGLRRLGVPDLDIQHLLGHKCLPTGRRWSGAREISAELIHRLGDPT